MEKYESEDTDIHAGIRVEGIDAGMVLFNDVAQATALGFLEKAKDALAHSDIDGAKAFLQHAKELRADPALVKQLEHQVDLLKRKQLLHVMNSRGVKPDPRVSY